jgi:hypothetical protein
VGKGEELRVLERSDSLPHIFAASCRRCNSHSTSRNFLNVRSQLLRTSPPLWFFGYLANPEYSTLILTADGGASISIIKADNTVMTIFRTGVGAVWHINPIQDAPSKHKLCDKRSLTEEFCELVLGTENQFANHRVQAIGSDYHIVPPWSCVFERNKHPAVILRHARNRVIENHLASPLNFLKKQLGQVPAR